MSLINKIPGVVFTQPLPKLYRDAVIGTSTLAAYDAINTASWPKQAAPVTGVPSSDKWVNLVSGTADGLLNLAGSGDIGFSGGFTLNGGTRSMKLLNNTLPSAPSKVLGITWFKHRAQTNTTTDCILNCAQWIGLYMAQAAQTNVAANRFYLTGQGSANREIPIGAPVVGSVYQIAVYYESVTRIAKAFVNGVEVLSVGGFADLTTGTDGLWVGLRTGMSAAYVGTIDRVVIDTLTDGRTAAEVVALDYALNAGRFS